MFRDGREAVSKAQIPVVGEQTRKVFVFFLRKFKLTLFEKLAQLHWKLILLVKIINLHKKVEIKEMHPNGFGRYCHSWGYGTDALGVSTNSTTYQLCDFGPVTSFPRA